jgi:rubrerythrin
MAPSGPSPTRRDLLVAGGATAGAALLSGCGTSGPARPDRRRDAGQLNMLLGWEHTAVAAYRAGSPVLRGRALATARRIVAQEQAHARVLERTVRGLGGHPHGPLLPQEYARRFPRLRNSSDALRFARDLERRIIRAYLEVLQLLTDARLRPQLAAIVASEAEHLAVVSELRGEAAAPEAFVTGKER